MQLYSDVVSLVRSVGTLECLRVCVVSLHNRLGVRCLRGMLRDVLPTWVPGSQCVTSIY
jgi:hypothetical protein